MAPPPDLSSYRLSDEDVVRIFNDEILPAEFEGLSSASSSPSSRPLAVLAVGQTGAGKTRLAPAVLAALKASSRPSQPAHFIADTYKTYHPSYTRLMLESPHLASPATGPDARRWLAMAADEAVRRRMDVLLESACRHPDDFVELATIFRRGGYRVEVLVLAVPAALSRLGILTRFYEKLPEGQSRNLPVRLTPTKVHNDSYAGLLQAAAFLDREAAADQVLVVRRGNLVAYGTDGGGVGKENGSVSNALLRERERPLTQTEMKAALDAVQKLSTNEEAKEQLEEIRAMVQPLLSDSSGGGHDTDTGEFRNLLPLEFGTGPGSHVLRLGETAT